MTGAPLRDSVRTVGVLGGGTAGYLTALALRRHVPELRVEVIASRDIPPIGVGESTFPGIVRFLHEYLGLDVATFYRAVRPTWKLGGRFEWGHPGDHWFNFPFERIEHEVAHADGWDVRRSSLLAVYMDAGKTPLMRGANGDEPSVPVKRGRYAYHLDNRSFIAYLRDRVEEAGIHLTDARVVAVERGDDGEVSGLLADDGRVFRYDLYVDCSGFGSLLLGGALGVPFVDYRSSVFTDRAILASVPNGGRIRPYTTARTMASGWMWTIPMRETDHVGYVFSSEHCAVDEAAAEMEAVTGMEPEDHVLRFSSGRRARAWERNVVAVGNAFAFVDPLESTAIQMILVSVRKLVDALRAARSPDAVRAGFNDDAAASWDFLRGFLALHFRFNRRLDTPFWRDCRESADMVGLEPMVHHFHRRGLVSLAEGDAAVEFARIRNFTPFGTNGIDVVLLGQGERPPDGSLPHSAAGSRAGRRARWFRRKRALWERMSDLALEPAEALPLVERRPELAGV